MNLEITKKLSIITLLLTLNLSCYTNRITYTQNKNYSNQEIVHILEDLAKEGSAEIEEMDDTRIIGIDLNHLDDGKTIFKGQHPKNHPSLYHIFGVDSFLYIDNGKNSFNYEDKFLIRISDEYFSFTIIESKFGDNSLIFGTPIHPDKKGEINLVKVIYNTQDQFKGITRKQEYNRFKNHVAKYLEEKLK
ncbi:hypothetical protein CL617_02765 [archaeon]|nr:hypothetical protein [archaeon]|tara:strand:+ start:19676 stop:20245 length:570 start_codon:yes stop_codon:yes gene_type:complete